MTNETTVLTEAVASLLARLAQLEEEAAGIRATLKGVRKQIAGGGPRAGSKARRGKRRKAADLEAIGGALTQ